MKISQWMHALAAAVFAATLSLSMTGAALAQDGNAEDGPLGKIHKKEGVTCAKCHGTAKKSEPIPLERCVSCHGKGDVKALVAQTAKAQPLNPHQNRHYGNQADCSLCHREHDVSVNFCADCHPRFDLKVK